MLWLQCLLGNGKNLLQLWKKYAIYAESNGVRPEQPWRHLNPWIRDQGKPQPWSQAQSFWTTKDVLPGKTDAQKGSTGKARKPSDHTFTMVRRSRRGWQEHHIMLYDRIALEKLIYTATRAERIQNSKHWILTANAEGGTQLSLNQRPDFAQAKRECKRLHDEHLARTQQDHRDTRRSQQIRQRKGQQFEGNEEYDNAVDPKTGWRFYRQSRTNLQTTSSSTSTWDQTQWKTSNWNSQHSLSPDDWWIFLKVRTHFGCLERNLQPTDGVCEQYTHKYSTYRVAQHFTFHLAWLEIKDCTSLRPEHNCHPRVMSHSLPHLTLTTRTSSLSPISSTSPIFPTVSPSQTSPVILNPYIPCDGPRQGGGSTQIPSLTDFDRDCCRGDAVSLSTSFCGGTFQRNVGAPTSPSHFRFASFSDCARDRGGMKLSLIGLFKMTWAFLFHEVSSMCQCPRFLKQALRRWCWLFES